MLAYASLHLQLHIYVMLFQKTNSIVLMAVVDAHYKFIAVDIGQYGSCVDRGVWRNSRLGARMDSATPLLPGYSPIPDTTIEVPHVFLGDKAFQLRHNFMRPYPVVSRIKKEFSTIDLVVQGI